MRNIILFAEDFAHESFLNALVERLARDLEIEVTIRTRSASGGYGRMVSELKQYLRELSSGDGPLPDGLLIARDANCKGFQACRNELEKVVPDSLRGLTIYAIPDPHIERWLLLDPPAFKAVLGSGCSTPSYKCEKARYKKLLIEAILATGVSPLLGGIEHTEDIVRELNLTRLEQADNAFGRLLKDLRSNFKQWATVDSPSEP